MKEQFLEQRAKQIERLTNLTKRVEERIAQTNMVANVLYSPDGSTYVHGTSGEARNFGKETQIYQVDKHALFGMKVILHSMQEDIQEGDIHES